jgi:branched-chain amino acid aminotransferase
MKYDFSITRTTTPKQKPDISTVTFGTSFTDHMFLMNYDPEHGWHDGRVVPYAPLSLDPATVFLHYAQGIFEGMKAYRDPQGKVQLFRPDMNAKRTQSSSKRMCIPTIDVDMYVEAVKTLVRVDQDWVPSAPGSSLYIRPFIFASESFVGVRPSNEFIFCIICCPVGSYYKGGMKPTKIYVEEEYTRAVKGGTGSSKVCGNYAPGLLREREIHELGYDQILWLDGAEHKYVEEIGTSNAVFKVGDEIWTATLETGTILPGITRDSALQVLRSWGYKVCEKRFTIEEIYEAYKAGQLKEVFATGTAAVISPVGSLCRKDETIVIGDGNIGPVAQKLYDTLTGIQYGRIPDENNWIVRLS